MANNNLIPLIVILTQFDPNKRFICMSVLFSSMKISVFLSFIGKNRAVHLRLSTNVGAFLPLPP